MSAGNSLPKNKLTDAAQIEGRGLVQVFINQTSPTLIWYVAIDGKIIEYINLIEFSVIIDLAQNMITGNLIQKCRTIEGNEDRVSRNLFPGVVEVYHNGRVIQVVNEDGTLPKTFVSVGKDQYGQSLEVSGLQELILIVSQGLFEAKVVWDEGDVPEGIFNELPLIN